MTTDHTGLAGLEKDELHAMAREFEGLRTEIRGSYTADTVPDLVTASRHLTVLAELNKDLSEAVEFRAPNTDPRLDFGPVIFAYTGASAWAGRALSSHAEAFEQLGFLRRYAETWSAPDVRAFATVARERLGRTVDELQETVGLLRVSADRIDGTPPRVLAALNRSSRPSNSIYRVPDTTPTAAPVRLAYTPAPRHAR